MAESTRICDFNKTFLRWGIDTRIMPPKTVSRELPMTLNHVRVPAECLAEVTDLGSGESASFLLGTSCKTEQVFVKKDIWHDPNGDFCMIAGKDRFLNLKRWDKTDKGIMRYPESLGVQPERQLEDPKEAFTRYSLDIEKIPGKVIDDIEELIAIFDAGGAVVSRTSMQSPSWKIAIEYPVKTVNYSDRERYYQVDTGPVLFPDLTAPFTEVLNTFQLAFVAHNEPRWAEFLLCVPTPLNREISVHHFSKSVRVDCHNEMIAVSGT